MIAVPKKLGAFCRQPRIRRLLWAAGVVLFYTVFGFLILPLIVRAVAVKQMAKLLDREVVIEKVKINPYVLSASIHRLLIKDKDGERFVALKEGYANFQLISFFQRAWTFKEIRVVEPFARVQVNQDSTLNFSDLLTKFGAPEKAPPGKPSKPLILHIDQLHIAGAELSFADLTTSTPFHRRVGPVQLTLTGLHTDPENKNPYSFSGTTDSGERFSWSGHFFLGPLSSQGEFAVENVSLKQYAPAYQDLVRFDIPDGFIDVRAAYDFRWRDSLEAASVTNATFRLRSLKLAEKGKEEPFAKLDSLEVARASADAVSRRADIDSITVRGGWLRLVRNKEAAVNVVEMARPASTNLNGSVLLLLQTATNLFAQLLSSTNAGGGAIRSLTVTNCAVDFEDQANDRPVSLAVSDMALSATNLSNLPGAKMGGAASLRWNTNGAAESGFALELSPPLADVSMKVDQVDLSPLGPYLDSFVSLFVVGSKFSMAGRVQLASTNQAGPNATFAGSARLDDFAGVDAATGQEILRWKSVALSDLRANLNPPECAVAEVDLNDVSARVVLETNQTLNLMRVARLDRAAAPAATNAVSEAPVPAAPSSAPAGVGGKVGMLARMFSSTNLQFLRAPIKASAPLVVLSNAKVQLEDQSISPPARLALRSINGKVTGIAAPPSQEIKFELATKVDGTGPVEVTGVLPPASPSATNRIQVQVQNVNLTPASSYSGKFLGYALQKGKLNLDIDYAMTERHIDAKNVLKLDQFTLGQKVASPDATRLPVKLAVAILKDRNGMIDLDVPIEGNLDDPQFRIGKAVLHVLGNLVTKLVTSPFAALGSLFGGKGEEVSYQPFKPGSVDLLPESRGNLETLLKGLQERPGLQLAIEGSFDPVTDADGLRRRKLEQSLRTEKWRALGKSAQEKTTPEQIEFTTEEFARAVKRIYAAMMATNTAPATEPGTAPAVSTKAPVGTPAEAVAFEKGATRLSESARPAAPPTPEAEMERAVLAKVPVTDEELKRLAQERAARVQQAISAMGLIEAERVSIADPATLETTNQAARVFFHLQ